MIYRVPPSSTSLSPCRKDRDVSSILLALYPRSQRFRFALCRTFASNPGSRIGIVTV